MLFIKYSHRKDAPGCLDSRDKQVQLDDKQFKFTAIGVQSERKISFNLEFELDQPLGEYEIDD